MKRIHHRAAVACAVVAMLLANQLVRGQQQDPKPPARPPEVENLLQLAKDPDRLRQALSDAQQVGELLDLVESEAVREFARDPQNILRLMSEINPGQIRDAIRSIDPSVARKAVAERWMERLRKQLGATDEEWKVLSPRVENLLRARQEARAGIRGFRPGAAGRSDRTAADWRNPFGAVPGKPSDVEYAAETVRLAVESPEIPDRDAALALKEYRRARGSARGRLAAAERELRELVTLRQEAILMTLGLLE